MSSRRSTFLPSLAALGALSCQPVLDSEVPGSSPYLISQETPQGAAIVLDPERRPRRFREAPMLARLVARGKRPPVEERLPENPLVLTLEKALAFIQDDELVEITPDSIRLRKRHLNPHERRKAERAAS